MRRAPSERGAQIRCRESLIIICGSLNISDIEHSPSSFQPGVDELLELEFWQHFGKRVRKVIICPDIGIVSESSRALAREASGSAVGCVGLQVSS